MQCPFKIIFNDDELIGQVTVLYRNVVTRCATEIVLPCSRRIDHSGHSIKDALSITALANRYNSIFDNSGLEEKRQILKKNENNGTANSIFGQNSDQAMAGLPPTALFLQFETIFSFQF